MTVLSACPDCGATDDVEILCHCRADMECQFARWWRGLSPAQREAALNGRAV